VSGKRWLRRYLGLNMRHILVREAEMMTNFMDEHMHDQMA
jgi:hypothetical protein